MHLRFVTIPAIVAIVLMAIMPTQLWAHVGVASSTPAENAVVDTQLGSFEILFTDVVRVTSLQIVQLSDDIVEDLTFEPVRKFATDVSGPLPPHSPGQYELRWRALSKDMHVMTGVIHFTIGMSGMQPGAKR